MSGTFGEFVRRHSLPIGIGLMFLLTWPIDLAHSSVLQLQVPFVVYLFLGWGFVVAALAMTAITLGKSGVIALLKRFLIWRVGWNWILIALFFCIGVPAGAGYPPLITLFQRAAPDHLRGRMFAITGTSQAAASILGAAIAGALGDHVGVMDLLTVQGAGYVAAAIVLRIMIGQGPGRHDPAVRERTRARRPEPWS